MQTSATRKKVALSSFRGERRMKGKKRINGMERKVVEIIMHMYVSYVSSTHYA